MVPCVIYTRERARVCVRIRESRNTFDHLLKLHATYVHAILSMLQ